MILPFVAPHRHNAHPAGLPLAKQGATTGSKYAERRRLIGKAQLASAG
jgi:hypothetical protein